jgi:hypothetical protein
MTDQYPDILGYVTGGPRANTGVLQVATTLRPRVIMAGRPLEMLLLVQNASDAEVELTATLRLPQLDAKKQKGRFLTKADRLIVKVGAGAVGMITLPVSTLPDTAVGADYRIGMELKAAPTGSAKPSRVRPAEGAEPATEEDLPPASRDEIEALKKLPWSANLSGSIIVNTLTVMSGKVGAFADLAPRWTSLWTIADMRSDRLLLQSIAPTVLALLPQLKRANILPIMREYTVRRFADAGYELTQDEEELIARYLTLLLEEASPDDKEALFKADSPYNVRRFFTPDGRVVPTGEVRLPHWLAEVARPFTQDVRTTQFPLKAVAHFAYDALLRDAMLHGFNVVETRLQINVGTAEERQQYIDNVLEALRQKALNYELLYMPLMLGAFGSVETVLMKNERPQDIIQKMRRIMDDRFREQTAETRQTYRMATNLVEATAVKYGNP